MIGQSENRWCRCGSRCQLRRAHDARRAGRGVALWQGSRAPGTQDPHVLNMGSSETRGPLCNGSPRGDP